MRPEHLAPYVRWLEAHIAAAPPIPEVAALVAAKRRHSYAVLGHVRALLRRLRPEPRLARLAEIAALLHDTGRFPQLAAHGTLDDTASMNHGLAGARILARGRVLNELSRADRGVVLCAVSHHNRRDMPCGLPADKAFVLGLVRDADKLDILRRMPGLLAAGCADARIIREGVADDGRVSPGVAEQLLARRRVAYSDVRRVADYALFLCGWIYDLNFGPSFQILHRRGNLAALLSLPPLQPDAPAMAKLRAQIEGDLEMGCRAGRSAFRGEQSGLRA